MDTGIVGVDTQVGMAANHIAHALERVGAALRRRPDIAVHEDAPATALWTGGTSVVAQHANGTRVCTDMPDQLGGTGAHVTPGWLFRAGIASCAVARLAMAAAAERIELESLEVCTSSRSDTRGMLGLPGDEGEEVNAGPLDMQVRVRIRATGVSPQRLRDFVERAIRISPMTCAVQQAVPVGLHIDVEDR